jgi:hypothetical protein
VDDDDAFPHSVMDRYQERKCGACRNIVAILALVSDTRAGKPPFISGLFGESRSRLDERLSLIALEAPWRPRCMGSCMGGAAPPANQTPPLPSEASGPTVSLKQITQLEFSTLQSWAAMIGNPRTSRVGGHVKKRINAGLLGASRYWLHASSYSSRFQNRRRSRVSHRAPTILTCWPCDSLLFFNFWLEVK